MKLVVVLLLPFLLAFGAPSNEAPIAVGKSSVEILFFVSEKCPICQYYTAKINQVVADYPEYKVTLVFPNDLSNPETMETFKKKYKLTANMKLDRDHTLVQQFGATVTPEVVVFNSNTETIHYQGRIDDNYYRVGKRRTVVKTNDLINALNALQIKKDITTAKTTPVGCFITQKQKK
ncbi:redoxin domain-containing protein [Crocinitomicaceae bacterium]|nr:redoxin domain-containing protein [Crocinitomicaceae bacterium]